MWWGHSWIPRSVAARGQPASPSHGVEDKAQSWGTCTPASSWTGDPEPLGCVPWQGTAFHFRVLLPLLSPINHQGALPRAPGQGSSAWWPSPIKRGQKAQALEPATNRVGIMVPSFLCSVLLGKWVNLSEPQLILCNRRIIVSVPYGWEVKGTASCLAQYWEHSQHPTESTQLHHLPQTGYGRVLRAWQAIFFRLWKANLAFTVTEFAFTHYWFWYSYQ